MVKEAHVKHQQRMKLEKEELDRQKESEKRKLADVEKQKKMIDKAEKRTSSLDKQEKKLNEDEIVVNTEFDLAQRMLSSARNRPATTISGVPIRKFGQNHGLKLGNFLLKIRCSIIKLGPFEIFLMKSRYQNY